METSNREMTNQEEKLANPRCLLEIPSIYGIIPIEDPLAIDLIQHLTFQRLKGIHQYGVVPFILKTESYNRFDHSLGVYWLLKKNGADRLEQIAGLLHDVSHTVFSHVGDYVFQDHYPGSSYQDDIHIWFLKESGLEEVLLKHQLTAEQVYHKNPQFVALDRELPELCADRIEYNLQGGLLRGLIAQEEFAEIVSSISYKNGSWVFQDKKAAAKVGACSLKMTETLWGAPWEAIAYRFAADALKRSFQIGLVTFNEFHFSTDEVVWKKLIGTDDSYIKECVDKMLDIHNAYKLTTKDRAEKVLYLKFRGIDPLIHAPEGTIPLTQIDADYKAEYERVKQVMNQGWPVAFSSY